MDILEPDNWAKPRGYSNGGIADGRFVFLAGQIGWDANQKLVSNDFVAQLRQALLNIKILLETADTTPAALVRLTWYVTDMSAYRSRIGEVGAAYRDVLGKVFPPMAVVAVTELVELGAMVEIEATAVLPR